MTLIIALIAALQLIQTLLLSRAINQLKELNKTNERRKEVSALLKGLKTIQIDE